MKTVTGLFETYEEGRDAVSALEAAGVPSSDISIVANNAADSYEDERTEAAEGAGLGAGIGAVIGGAGGLLAGLGLMAIPGVGPVVAAGWLVAALTGAAAGAVVGGAGGGMVGALIKSGIPETHAHAYAEGIRRGGTLVTARVEDSLAPRAESILQQSRVNIEDRRRTYTQEGWEKFDDTLPPYTKEEVERERDRLGGM